MLVVLVLAWQAMRWMEGKKGEVQNPALRSIEAQMRSDLEETTAVALKVLTTSFLSGTNSSESFLYEGSGDPPYRRLDRAAKNGRTTLLERIARFRFTGYDENGRFFPDVVPESDLPRVSKIRVEIGIHDAAENPSLVINDGIRGIDLDRDPGNGVAAVREISFGLILKH